MNLSKQFTRREKVLLVVLAVLLVVGGYFLAVHRPTTEELKSLAEQQAEADTRLVLLEAKQDRMDVMQAELEAVLAEPHPAAVPDYDNLQSLMTFLDSTMAGTDSFTVSAQAVQLPKEGSIVRRNMEISFRCIDYARARLVTQSLISGPYLCLADKITIAPVSNGADSITTGSVQVTVSITFFERVR